MALDKSSSTVVGKKAKYMRTETHGRFGEKGAISLLIDCLYFLSEGFLSEVMSYGRVRYWRFKNTKGI